MDGNDSVTRRLRALVAAVLGAVLVATAVAPAVAAQRPRTVSGWFGYWTDAADMVAVAQRGGRALGEVNIFWWNYGSPAHPVCTSTRECPWDNSKPWATSELLAAARGLQAKGVLVYATHTDLDGAKAGSLSQFLAKQKRRVALARQLTDWADRAGVDGVDLDWENFAFNDGSDSWDATRPRLVRMVKLLSKTLHAKGLRLSVTVPGGYQPFLSDGSPNPGGGYTVFDWAKLAPWVDRLRLMTYDYSWDRPGPIGPHDWARSSVKSAIAQVGDANRRKIYVGVHQYGKAWYDRDSDDDYVTVGECDDRWEPDGSDAISLTVAEARALAADYGVTPRYDPASKESTFSYVKTETGRFTNDKGKTRVRECNVRKEVWFGTRATAAGRMKMVRKQRIGGIAVWNLAALDAGFFSAVRPYVPTRAAKRR